LDGVRCGYIEELAGGPCMPSAPRRSMQFSELAAGFDLSTVDDLVILQARFHYK